MIRYLLISRTFFQFMMRTLKDFAASLPKSTPVWLYLSSRDLSPSEQEHLIRDCESFFVSWTSHQRPVTATVIVLADRVLVLAADIPDAQISGCGIDKWVHFVESLADRTGFQWLGALDVAVRRPGGHVDSMTRTDFRKEVSAGTIDSTTRVFDISARSIGRLLESGVERPASESWHKMYLRIESASPASVIVS